MIQTSLEEGYGVSGKVGRLVRSVMKKRGGRGYKYLKSGYSVTPHNRDSGEAQVVSQEAEQSLGQQTPLRNDVIPPPNILNLHSHKPVSQYPCSCQRDTTSVMRRPNYWGAIGSSLDACRQNRPRRRRKLQHGQ